MIARWLVRSIFGSLLGGLFLIFPVMAEDEPGVALVWNTFVGATDIADSVNILDTEIDASGNIYVAGQASNTWGTPVDAHAGGLDGFVAKFNANGVLQWHTFIGSTEFESARKIVVDSAGNSYIVGPARGTWGSPVQSNLGVGDGFVAKLNANGGRVWNTFIGSQFTDSGTFGVALNSAEDTVYATGGIRGFGFIQRVYVARLNGSDGARTSLLMFGDSLALMNGFDITVDAAGNTYTTGTTNVSFGNPVDPYEDLGASQNVFVAKHSNAGSLVWNTFIPASNSRRVRLDGNGSVYVTGASGDSWGNPRLAHKGGFNGFVQKLNSSGARVWNTFLGAATDEDTDDDASDTAADLAFGANGSLYVAGFSFGSWGKFEEAAMDRRDIFIAQLSSSGRLRCNAFLGSDSGDEGAAIEIDSSGNLIVAGKSDASWGASPIVSFIGPSDGVVAKATLRCPEIPGDFFVIPLQNNGAVIFNL